MGYSTYFEGEFSLSRRLTASELETMSLFTTGTVEDPEAPDCVCQWVIDTGPGDQTHVLRHDYEEKFSHWEDWISYVAWQLEEWDVKLNGDVVFHGENTGDCGRIIVKDNTVNIFSIRELLVPNHE